MGGGSHTAGTSSSSNRGQEDWHRLQHWSPRDTLAHLARTTTAVAAGTVSPTAHLPTSPDALFPPLPACLGARRWAVASRLVRLARRCVRADPRRRPGMYGVVRELAGVAAVLSQGGICGVHEESEKGVRSAATSPRAV